MRPLSINSTLAYGIHCKAPGDLRGLIRGAVAPAEERVCRGITTPRGLGSQVMGSLC